MNYRQGDVLIVAVAKRPTGLKKAAREEGRIVLAHGEATGHAHAILDKGATLYGTDLNNRFLEVLAEGGVDLVHEEHATITIPPGDYQIVRQREYTPEAVRYVAD